MFGNPRKFSDETLNVLKAWHSFPSGSLKKREPSRKHFRKKWKSSNRCWRLLTKITNSETKKVKQPHSKISNSSQL